MTERRRRPYAIAIYKGGRRHWYGFTTRRAAEAFRLKHEPAYPGHVSAVITLGGRRGSR